MYIVNLECFQKSSELLQITYISVVVFKEVCLMSF